MAGHFGNDGSGIDSNFVRKLHPGGGRIHAVIFPKVERTIHSFAILVLCIPNLNIETEGKTLHKFHTFAVCMARSTTKSRKAEPARSEEENFQHLQPQALELERDILGALMVDSEALDEVVTLLAPDSFYDKRNGLIYSAILRLEGERKPIDLLTVAEKLRQMGELEHAGGEFYVGSLAEDVTGSAHIVYHAAIVREKALARRLISYSSVVQTNAFDETKDIKDVMQDAESRLFEIAQSSVHADYTQINPVLQAAYKKLRDISKKEGGMTGIPSLYHELDKMTSGWQDSNLIIVAARPSMGKTAFALCMAKNIAVEQRIPTGFFSLEMSNMELVNRLISNVCGIQNDKLRSGQLADYEWTQLDTKIQQLEDAPLYIDDTSNMSVFELKTKARRMVRERGVKIIMVDYLQLMTASGSNFGSRQEEVSTISRTLKGLAKELNIPIIALSQVSRQAVARTQNAMGTEGATNESFRPQLNDLRESGAIEQDADVVIFIHRPEYYGCYKDSHGHDTRGKAEIIIAKQRNGAVGIVNLSFKAKYATFLNKDDEIVAANGKVERYSALNEDDTRETSDEEMPF